MCTRKPAFEPGGPIAKHFEVLRCIKIHALESSQAGNCSIASLLVLLPKAFGATWSASLAVEENVAGLAPSCTPFVTARTMGCMRRLASSALLDPKHWLSTPAIDMSLPLHMHRLVRGQVCHPQHLLLLSDDHARPDNHASMSHKGCKDADESHPLIDKTFDTLLTSQSAYPSNLPQR